MEPILMRLQSQKKFYNRAGGKKRAVAMVGRSRTLAAAGRPKPVPRRVTAPVRPTEPTTKGVLERLDSIEARLAKLESRPQ